MPSRRHQPSRGSTFAEPRTRRLTVLGQDPTLTDDTGVVTVQVEIARERLAPGPQGARLHVVDCDASTGTLYKPVTIGEDRFANVSDVEKLVGCARTIETIRPDAIL